MKDTIIFKVDCKFKKQLQKEAQEKNLTLSSYIKSIIDKRDK